jgi:hypothetical protein
MGLLRPLLCLVRACRCTSSAVTPQGYKSRQLPLRTLMSSRTIHHSLLTSFPEKERKKWRKKREKKRGLPRFREFCFSFLFKPW